MMKVIWYLPETVPEPLVHGGQSVFNTSARLQSLGLQFRPGKLQGLAEQLQGPHVQQQLLEAALEGPVLALYSSRPRGFSQAAQGSCLGPGNADDGVHQH